MKKVYSLDEFIQGEATAVALGNFDGVHMGHRAVIGAAVNSKGLTPAVFTFAKLPHSRPAIVMSDEKERVIEQAGIELLCCVDFEEVKDIDAHVFFEQILVNRLRAKKLCCGKDFRFGKDAAGDVELLGRLCKERDIQLDVVPFVTMDGKKVSSTRIRRALEEGRVEEANKMLGRPFSFSLEVIHGNHIGRGLGTPTINQALPKGFILPKFGVYASLAKVEDSLYYGVTNIGVKPTVGSDRVLSETWMPDFSGDLYGKKIRLYIYGFIRPERRFSSLEDMKKEIIKNAVQSKEIVEKTAYAEGGKSPVKLQ